MARKSKAESRGSSSNAAPARKHRSRRDNVTEINQPAISRRRNPKVPDLPPNENLDKHPDETYGDTEIPERNEDI